MRIGEQAIRRTTNLGFTRVDMIHLKRVAHELYCWISLLSIFPSYFYGGVPLFLFQTILGGGGACLCDWFIGPTMKNNISRITANGHGGKQKLLAQMYLTVLTSESILLSLAVFSGCFDATLRCDACLLYHVAATLAFNEAVFTLVHRFFLHGTPAGARIHEIHHSCHPASFSSGFIFHFLDSNMEFTFAHICMASFSNWAFRDPFSLLVSLQLSYFFYVIDHSENLQLPHYWHHQWINANYSAYTNVLLLKGKDYVRETLSLEKSRSKIISNKR